MYLPRIFALEDPAVVVRLLREHPFAIMVTADDQGFETTHLPLCLEVDREEKPLRLAGHVARANPHAEAIRRSATSGSEALALFQGPHAYVSPSLYQSQEAVPTWNYLAVEVRGRLTVVADPEQALAHLTRLVEASEAGRAEPWQLSSQSQAFLQRQLRGILAFEMTDLRVTAKAKLSQNRPAADRMAVTEAMKSEAPDLAVWMDPSP